MINFTPTGGSVAPVNFKPSLDNSMAGLAHSQTMVSQLQQSANQAKQTADQAASPMGIAAETVKGTAGGFGDILKGIASPFARLGVNAIKTGQMALGQKVDVAAPINLPILGETKPVGQEGNFGQKLLDTGVTGAEIGSTVLGGGGAKVAAQAPLNAAVNTAKEALIQQAEKDAIKTAIKALTPKLSSNEIENAAKGGQITRSFLGGSKIDMTKNMQFMRSVDAVKGIVKGKSAAEDINSVRSSLSNEAESLKTLVSQNDHPYTFKELESRLTNVEEPISLRGTPFEKQIGPIKQAAIDIAKKNGGSISGLLDARKEFDQLVEKTYPNLYNSDSAPIKNAITSIRKEINNFIDDNLPNEAGFKQSLDKQKLFYDAIDNLASKAPGEIRQGGIFKKVLKNPFVQAGIGAAGGTAVVGEGKKLLGN